MICLLLSGQVSSGLVPSLGTNDFVALLPPLILTFVACALLALDSWPHQPQPVSKLWLALAGMAAYGVFLLRQWSFLDATGQPAFSAMQAALSVDHLSLLTNAIVAASTVLFFLISYRFLITFHQEQGTFYALTLLAVDGMYFMSMATELVSLLVALELTALCSYILVGFIRSDRKANEAAVKYLLLGAISTAFLLYGFSLLYGISGSTGFAGIASAVKTVGPSSPVVIFAVLATLVGLLFKISVVPFHSWTPDAYDGAPTPVTAFLSVAPKAAGMVVLLRVLFVMLPSAQPIWMPFLTVCAVASLTVGTIAALTQQRLKRLFAYSSIAHAGYLLLGAITAPDVGLAPVLVYLVVFALMNLGAFAVLVSLNVRGNPGDTIEDLRGLSRTRPLHAALFVLILVSLAGLPPTAGFIAKYLIFAALVKTQHYILAAIASAYVVASLYFYFRLVHEMYFKDAAGRQEYAVSLGTRLVLYATAAFLLLAGVFPEPVVKIGSLVGGAH